MKHLGLTMSLLVCLATVALLVACGGTPKPPDPNDKTPPALSSSIPKTGATAVPINVKLAFNFSKAMDKASLELSSSPAINLGKPNWNAGNTSVAFDNATLAASTAYTLTLKAKDPAGNALATTTLAFSTSDTADTTAPGTPTGLVATPANGQVTLTWQASPEDDVVGYTVYMGTAANALEPQDFVTTTSKTITNLTNGTSYFFAVDAVDAANNHSGQSIPVSATPSATTINDPRLVSTEPANDVTEVSPRNPVIKLVFSKPMQTTDFTVIITPPLVAIDAVPGEPLELSWSEDDTVVTIRPKSSEFVPENTQFTLMIERATDKTGRPLIGNNQLRFTTGAEAFKLLSSSPAQGQTSVPDAMVPTLEKTSSGCALMKRLRQRLPISWKTFVTDSYLGEGVYSRRPGEVNAREYGSFI